MTTYSIIPKVDQTGFDVAELLSLCLGASLPSQRALDQQVFLELRHCGDDAHCHLTGWARQIDGTQRQAMNADPLLRQLVDSRLDVDRVATQPVQLRHHE